MWLSPRIMYDEKLYKFSILWSASMCFYTFGCCIIQDMHSNLRVWWVYFRHMYPMLCKARPHYSLPSSSEAYLLGHKLVCNKGHCVCLRLYDGQCHDKTISSECTTDEDCQLVHHSLSVCVKGFCACPAQHKLMNTHCVDVSTMKGNFTLHLQC